MQKKLYSSPARNSGGTAMGLARSWRLIAHLLVDVRKWDYVMLKVGLMLHLICYNEKRTG